MLRLTTQLSSRQDASTWTPAFIGAAIATVVCRAVPAATDRALTLTVIGAACGLLALAVSHLATERNSKIRRAGLLHRDGELAYRHDLDAALLAIDGGIMALAGGASPTAVAALREEVARVRRLTVDDGAKLAKCDVAMAVAAPVAVRRANGQRIHTRIPHLIAAMPADDLARVITNLLDNCSRHAPGAQVFIRAARMGDSCRILVRDDGPGIALELGDDVFDAGVSTRPGGGLGLAVVLDLVKKHGGSARLASASGEGMRILIQLPLVDDPQRGVAGRRNVSQPEPRQGVLS